MSLSPNWEIEQERRERPLWQIAALAGNVNPVQSVVKARMAADAAWSKGYVRMIGILTNALDPRPSDKKIFYDKEIPRNITRTREKRDLRNVLVNAASATKFLVDTYGEACIPRGFVRMHDSLNRAASETSSQSSPKDKELSSKKSQDLAVATKRVKVLTKLLIAVVECECGWSATDGGSKVGTLKKILAALDRHELGPSRFALGTDNIEAILDAASAAYPLRQEATVNPA